MPKESGSPTGGGSIVHASADLIYRIFKRELYYRHTLDILEEQGSRDLFRGINIGQKTGPFPDNSRVVMEQFSSIIWLLLILMVDLVNCGFPQGRRSQSDDMRDNEG